ncbi:hypothetical protein GW17_00058033 [Ensete ventricosum]|nr:hypothetical protein GW17_00058033 [Ensete ventricosum]
MHPLRFPNSGIKAKVFVRKIGFKLRVMRLNHVESFYAFLLYFRNEGSPCKGQLAMAMASPLAGAAGYGQPPCKGGQLWSGPLIGAATRSGSSPAGTNGCGQAAGGGYRCKAARGNPAARAATCKGGHWQERSPARAAPARGGAASSQGGARR